MAIRRDSLIIIIIMEICKAPTLRLKALNKHTHIMYIEMKSVINLKKKMFIYIYRQVFKHNYAKDAHTYTHARTHARSHARTHAHTHTHTHTHTVQTDGSDGQCGLTEIF